MGKTLMLGKTGGKRRRGQQRIGWLYSVIDSMDMSLSKLREIVKDREAWRTATHGVTKSQTHATNDHSSVPHSPGTETSKECPSGTRERERERGWAALLGMVQAVLCLSAVTSHEHKSLSGPSGSRV